MRWRYRRLSKLIDFSKKLLLFITNEGLLMIKTTSIVDLSPFESVVLALDMLLTGVYTINSAGIANLKLAETLLMKT